MVLNFVLLAVLVELLVLMAVVLFALLTAWAIWRNDVRKRDECHATLAGIFEQVKDYEKEPNTEKCKKINEAIRAYNAQCPDHTVEELDC
jgi:hypothetical protein